MERMVIHELSEGTLISKNIAAATSDLNIAALNIPFEDCRGQGHLPLKNTYVSKIKPRIAY